MRRRVHTKRAAQTQQMNDLHAVAAAFTGFRPAGEVFLKVKAVPTIFPDFDHGVRVGGLPTERIALVHGPSGEGKTMFTLGLVRSFLTVGNPVFFVDAERTLERGFIRLTLQDQADSPLFMGARPTSYEQTRVDVRTFCNRVAELRKRGKVHPDACGLVVVDSIRKLVPKDQWEKLLELAKNAKDEKARDRANQHKAQMNAAWCDELIPLLEQTGCTMVIIAREIEDADAPPPRAMPGRPPPRKRTKTGGGSALYYDASLDLEITRAAYVQKPGKTEGSRPVVYGERHRVTIKKSKVSGKEDKVTICHFHSSNGKLVPEGFDHARDLVDLGVRLGVIKGGKSTKGGGGWMQWQGRKWNGAHAAVAALTKDAPALAKLESAVRAKFASASPVDLDTEG